MTYGANTEQMVFLSDIMNEMVKDKEGFDLLTKHGTFMYVSKDDYCLSVEWVFKHMRIAIDIERNVIESEWSLTSDRHAGNYSTGGYLIRQYQSAIEKIYTALKEYKDNLDEDEDGEDNED